MPTYEYACEKCGSHFDVVHGFNERGPRKCKECGAGPLRKVFHPAGIVLKGSGFYKTDSRSGTSAGVGASSKPADSAPDSGAGSKSGDSSASEPATSSSSSSSSPSSDD